MKTFNVHDFINQLEDQIINEINNGNIQSGDDCYTYIHDCIDGACIYYSDCFDICRELNATDFEAYEYECTNITQLAYAALCQYTFESLDTNKFDELIQTINA